MNAGAQRIGRVALAALLLLAGSRTVFADKGSGSSGNLKPLNTVPVPLPPNLGDFVVNRTAAIQLGKALFWESQTGGDGQVACASCHFQAGADVRVINTVNPGANGIFDTVPPGGTVTAANFPIFNGDVIGSQGVFKRNFISLSGGPVDNCSAVDTSGPFGNNRQVTGRNTPFNINAIFNFRSFWDGRANNTFNGVNPAGPTDPTARVLKVSSGIPAPVQIALPNASLASQAVGPPNNAVEMSCAGRNFPQLGRKLLGLTPLGQQMVDPTDSVLASLSSFPNPGLNTSYAALIEAAFDPKWWNSPSVVGGFTVKENNFSLYWGLSILLYSSTLVSDQTRFDAFLAGSGSLTAQEQLGLATFQGKGRCTQCHRGGELTRATVSDSGGNGAGFMNTAVRPVADDTGDIVLGQGRFKIPGLRNTELNGPYFHNGELSTLRQVIDFYDRGGDFRSGFTDSQIRPLGFTAAEKDALVALILSMTDDRVRFQRAPFDHPSLAVPNGPNVPAVGAAGGAPFGTFLGLSPFQP